MNPDLPLMKREDLEAKVTGLLLGELPDDEAALLRELIARDAELARLRDRLKLTLEFLREATVASDPAPSAPQKMSERRREKLLAHFKTVAPAPRWKISWVAVAAVLAGGAILTGLLLPALSRAKMQTQRAMAAHVAEDALQPPAALQWAAPALARGGGGGASGSAAPMTREGRGSIALPRLKEAETDSASNFYVDHDTRQMVVSGDVSKDYPSNGAHPINSNEPADITYDYHNLPISQLEDIYQGLTGRTLLKATTGSSKKEPTVTLKMATPMTRSEAVTAVETVLGMNGITVVPVGDKFAKVVTEHYAWSEGGLSSANPNPPETGKMATRIVQVTNTELADVTNALKPFAGRDNSGAIKPAVINLKYAQASDIADALKALGASGGTSVGKSSTSPVTASRGTFQNNLARSKFSGQAKVIVDERNNSLLVFAGGSDREKIDDIVNKLDVAPQQAVSQPATPQPEVLTSSNAFSTFSLNVSDASFKLAQASLRNGIMPDPAGIRSEEFINAFDYRDPEPPPGAPIGFSWDQARYPFAHNRDLLRFSVKTAAQGRQAGRPLNLVLLLDKSGSMERADRVEIIHQALRVLASQLQAQDTLSVVVFARTARLWVDGVAGSQAGDIANRLDSLTPEGGTNLEEAMKLAYETALRHYLANGENRVALLTDGAANLGNADPETLKQKVEANQKQGIALDCFGIGWDGYNDTLMETLSRAGNGRYGFINTPEEAATEFAGQLAGALRVAASDVKVQVEFNPNRVTAYRQIGYAKHQLKKEQFRDNTVAAAQIGAAESGTALYTVEINPAGDGPLCTVRVRFRAPGTTDYQERAWDVPYNGAAGALDQASPSMRLAATASAFSEWLAGSPYAGEVSPDSLLGYLRDVPEIYGADTRPKNLEWMIRQAKSISGK
ncbi:MAG TPA: von Willebrand factor type A domain-containing protein [Verrucomicrobiae bacterium]|nr:von Willebrand factor type A domain-containing protein [Verrucomicrobiae bacterium]